MNYEPTATDQLTATSFTAPAVPQAADTHTPWLPVGLVFALSATGVWLVARRWLRQTESPLERARGQEPVPAGEADPRGWFGGWTDALASQIPESRQESRDFRKLLRGAGLYAPQALASIYALRFVLLFLPVVATGLAAVLAPSEHSLSILVCGGLVSASMSAAPRLFVFFRRRARQEKIRRGLPDALDMLGMCIGGGLGVQHSLEQVARQLDHHPELAQELRILGKQAGVGGLETALADFTARVDIAEARHLGSVLTRNQRLGVQLAGSLLTHADQLRTARRQQATLVANRAPVKLIFPLMFCFAPAAIILLCAPAMIELKEFLAPTAGQSVISGQAGSGIGAASIVTTLDVLGDDLAQ